MQQVVDGHDVVSAVITEQRGSPSASVCDEFLPEVKIAARAMARPALRTAAGRGRSPARALQEIPALAADAHGAVVVHLDFREEQARVAACPVRLVVGSGNTVAAGGANQPERLSGPHGGRDRPGRRRRDDRGSAQRSRHDASGWPFDPSSAYSTATGCPPSTKGTAIACRPGGDRRTLVRCGRWIRRSTAAARHARRPRGIPLHVRPS